MLSRFAQAVRFLTRLPVPGAWGEAEDLGKTASCFPAVGLVIGGVVALAALGVARLWHSPVLGAAAAVAANALVTGGLHLDGLMDTCDGIFGSQSRERALEIMRDPRVGSFGALGGAIAVLIRFALSGGGVAATWQGLLLAPVVGRCAQVWSVAAFPYARAGGMGLPFKTSGTRQAVMGVLFGMLACIAVAGWTGLAWLAGGLLAGALAAWMLHRRLGGLTGDCYGAVTEVSEWAALAVAALVPAQIWRL